MRIEKFIWCWAASSNKETELAESMPQKLPNSGLKKRGWSLSMGCFCGCSNSPFGFVSAAAGAVSSRALWKLFQWKFFPDAGVSTPNALALQCKKQTGSSPWGFSREQLQSVPSSKNLLWNTAMGPQGSVWRVAQKCGKVFLHLLLKLLFFPLPVNKLSNNLYKVRIISIKVSEKLFNTRNTEKKTC